MRSPVEAKCPVKGKTTPMEISLLSSSIWGVAGWMVCDIRSQAEKPTIKVTIAMINVNDFNSICSFFDYAYFERSHFRSVRFGEI
jgi:hypothetical protein